MKLSISLTEADVAALDDFVARAGLSSRSAAVQHAIRRLGDPGLEDAYAEAWKEWDASDDATSWASTRGDGLTRAAW